MTYHIPLSVKRPAHSEIDPTQLCMPTLKAFFGDATKQKIRLRRRPVPVGHTNILTDQQPVKAAGKQNEAARSSRAASYMSVARLGGFNSLHHRFGCCREVGECALGRRNHPLARISRRFLEAHEIGILKLVQTLVNRGG